MFKPIFLGAVLLASVAALGDPVHTTGAGTAGPLDASARHVGHGHLVMGHSLTLEGARVVLHAATTEARRLGVRGSYAVVDAGGHVLLVERLDGSVPATPPVAIAKARSAALFGKPTSVFESIINDGRTAMVTVPEFVPLQGGVPVVLDGHVVGAIGVSGASSARQDEELAVFGVNALLALP